MPDLEPITRNEKLWSGENLEPKTRREMYIRHLYDETQVIPDSPKTREEMFILKAGEELHDVTIEQLTATENGTYSEEGVAYSPVIVEVPEPTLISKSITANGNYSASTDNADGYSSVSVNVPLPSNAYLLQSIEHEQVATFTDGTDNFVKSLEVAIEPVQSGSGDPSPTNIRPISGWDECKVTVADDLENPTVSNVYTIDLDGTRYGGKLDVVNGVLTVDEVNVFLKDLTFTRQARGSNVGGYYFRAEIDDNAISDTDATQLYSHGVSNNPYTSKENCARAFESSAYLFVGFSDDMNITTLADFNTWISNNQNASICYKIKTPIEVQLTPTIIKSLQGDNNFIASTGEIKWMQYWGR